MSNPRMNDDNDYPLLALIKLTEKRDALIQRLATAMMNAHIPELIELQKAIDVVQSVRAHKIREEIENE